MKKKITALILCAFMIFTVTACKKVDNEVVEPNPEKKQEVVVDTKAEVETIKLIAGEGHREMDYEDTYTTVISTSYPTVLLYYGDEEKFPALQKALEESNEETREYQLEFLEENAETAKEFFDMDAEYFYPFESSVIPAVRRADTLITGILYEGFTYTGGVRGDTYYYGENYDTKTGKVLSLFDVTEDTSLLYDAVYDQLLKFYGEYTTFEYEDVAEALEEEELYSWTLDYNGITFYFLPYTFGAGYGTQIVTVSEAEYPGIIKEAFNKTPESYGVKLINSVPFYYDVTGDGCVDEVIFSGYENDYEGNSGNISFYINGEVFDEEVWTYGMEGTFVHTKDGKNYIYVELCFENDYRQIKVYELSDEVRYMGEIDGSLRRIYHESEDYIITQDALTNPESFYLQQTTQHLSTVTGYKLYYASENGMPVSNDKFFVFDEEATFTFTLISELTADVIDMKTGEITGTKTLKAGDEVLYIATDNENLGCLRCSDGDVILVETGYDYENYFRTIKGVDINEIFDGMMYAG